MAIELPLSLPFPPAMFLSTENPCRYAPSLCPNPVAGSLSRVPLGRYRQMTISMFPSLFPLEPATRIRPVESRTMELPKSGPLPPAALLWTANPLRKVPETISPNVSSRSPSFVYRQMTVSRKTRQHRRSLRRYTARRVDAICPPESASKSC